MLRLASILSLLLFSASFVLGRPQTVQSPPTPTAQAKVPFFTPTAGGGSWFDDAGNGLGEPLNVSTGMLFQNVLSHCWDVKVVISGLSSPEVLTDSGMLNFARALNLSVHDLVTTSSLSDLSNDTSLCSSTECAGIHLGAPQSANLGDGNGPVNQTIEIREDFGNAILGTCIETLTGGDHFRYVLMSRLGPLGHRADDTIYFFRFHSVYRQNGTAADSGALFLAYGFPAVQCLEKRIV